MRVNDWNFVDYPCFLKATLALLKADHILKCPHSDIYTAPVPVYEATKICPNDPRHYQACVVSGSSVATTVGAFSEDPSGPMCDSILTKKGTPSASAFNYDVHTLQISHKARFDRRIRRYFLVSGKDTKINCDGYCGTYNCEDEKTCNGITYGMHCNFTITNHTLIIHIPPHLICDGIFDCPHREDESELTCGADSRGAGILTPASSFNDKEIQFCTKNHLDEGSFSRDEEELEDDTMYNGGRILTLTHALRCSPLQYSSKLYKKNVNNLKNVHRGISGYYSDSPYVSLCKFYLDQTNCADPERVAVSCQINGVNATISKYAICAQTPGLCDDGLDNLCVETSFSCRVHKHLLCNGMIDCSDRTDETTAICLTMTESSCYRRYRHKKMLEIPIAWLGDGIHDCENGDDEQKIWPTCGTGKFSHFVTKGRAANCQEVFVCSPGSSEFVQLHELCGNYDKCGHLKMCNAAEAVQGNKIQPWSFRKSGAKDMVSFCVQGLMKSLSMHIATCTEESFNPGKIFGVKHLSAIIIPEMKVDCKHLFGKAYVYFSCSGKCVDQPQCPLRAPRYDACTKKSNIMERAFTLSEFDGTSRLTFLHKNKVSGKYENRNFQCKNDRCIDFKQLCNLVDNCGDGSDEEVCANNFQCDTPRRFIPLSYKCDGKFDCNDYSDECNKDCGMEIIEGLSLSMSSWMVGVAAVVFNITKIFNNIKVLVTQPYSSESNDKILTTVLHLGDLLTGTYLVVISIVDTLVYGTTYCRERFRWLSSNGCAALGVLSSFGAEMSLLAMTCLSVFRALGTNRLQVIMSRNGGIKMIILVLFIVAISFILAYMPLVERYEDYFVSAMTYLNARIKIFPSSIVTKKIHLEKIKTYFRKIRISRVKTWKKINQLTDEMFTKDYGGLGRKKIHFYGNDGVCLFKYFVSKEDPQIAYVWGCLGWNALCFLIIFICYTKVLIFSKESKRQIMRKRGVNLKEEEADEEAQKTQKHITAIVLTDFVCWIPFIVLCVLHFAEVIDAKPLYTVSSVVILPINSMINPILYNNALSKSIKIMLTKCKHWLTRLLAFIGRFTSSFNANVRKETENDFQRGIELLPITNRKNEIGTTAAESSTLNNTAESPTLNNTAESPTLNNTAESPTFNNTAESSTLNNTAESSTFNNTAESSTLNNTAESSTLNNTAESSTLNNTAESSTFNNTAESSTFNNTAESSTLKNTAESSTFNNTAESSTLNNTAESSTLNNTAESSTLNNTAKSSTLNNTAESSTLNNTAESSTPNNTAESSTLNNTAESSTLNNTAESSTLNNTAESSTLNNTAESSTLNNTAESSTLNNTAESSTLNNTAESSTLNNTAESSTLNITAESSSTLNNTAESSTFNNTAAFLRIDHD